MNDMQIGLNSDLETVIRHYSQMVYRLAFARTANKFDADEVYQEVFLRYVRKEPRFKDEEHRKAWLIKVTLNCSKNISSSYWNEHTQVLDENMFFETKQENELYYELLKLSPKYRLVVHLFYYEDMSVDEIAKVIGKNSSTVRSQLSRARDMLRRFMKEEDYV